VRRSGLRVSVLIAALLVGNLAVGQQLPPGPGPLPELRRGANGEIEVVPSPPKPHVAKVKPPKAPAEASAPAATAPSPPVAAARAVSRPAAVTINLSQPLAIELPVGVTELAPDSPPLRTLLDQTKSGERAVTNDLHRSVGAGAVGVTWTAWSGAPGTSHPVATASDVLFVLPSGVTPVGVTGDENATGGNNAAKIARNAAGNVVHIVWVDGGRPGKGTAVMYRRAKIAPDGTVRLGEPIRIDDAKSGSWNAYPGLAVADDAVSIAWNALGHTWYHRLIDHDGHLEWGPIRDVGAPSDGQDIGPSIAATGQLIHIATPSGLDAVSYDDGATWRVDKIPLSAGTHLKTISVMIDGAGRAHFAFSDILRGPLHASRDKSSSGYWELRYIRRDADDTWVDPENVLRSRPEWAEPANDDDVLADWVRLLVDDAGNIHITWHGTALSRIYGDDSAFYIQRAAEGAGWSAAWDAPQHLVPPDPAHGVKYSFAPSLALGRGIAVPVAFYEVYDGSRCGGFDALARMARQGTVEGPPLPVTRYIRASIDQHRPEMALSAQFPAAGPRLVYAPDGRIWLDVLETLIPIGVPTPTKLIAFQRVDVTAWLKGEK
jgi:hypothetical protein